VVGGGFFGNVGAGNAGPATSVTGGVVGGGFFGNVGAGNAGPATSVTGGVVGGGFFGNVGAGSAGPATRVPVNPGELAASARGDPGCTVKARTERATK
jgi:hypothetical protein